MEVKKWKEKPRKYKAVNEMILEKFLIEEVNIPLSRIRKIEVIRDKEKKCKLGQTLNENNIKEGSKIEIRNKEEKVIT